MCWRTWMSAQPQAPGFSEPTGTSILQTGLERCTRNRVAKVGQCALDPPGITASLYITPSADHRMQIPLCVDEFVGGSPRDAILRFMFPVDSNAEI